jgi:pimeloyl-ACP methyl ester carboxylesterase
MIKPGSTPIRVRPFAALLSPLINRHLYPGAEAQPSAEETNLELMVDGIALRGWEVNPGRKHALVYFGGNGEGLDWLVEPLSSKFPDHTSYLVAYRGYGASEGKPSERVLTTDALAVFDYAEAQHRGSVDVAGRSLGSAVAIQVAARRRVRRLVLITPFDSMTAVAAELYPRLPVRMLLRDRWDSAAVAHRLRAPVLIVRAGLDELVTPAATDRLLAALPAEPQVLTLTRSDHDTVDAARAFWPAIVTFLAP